MAIHKKPGHKTLKVGKKLSASKVRKEAQESKQEMNEAHKAAADSVREVNATKQD